MSSSSKLVLCRDTECPSNLSCMRYISRPPKADYFTVSPRNDGEHHCPWFVKTSCCDLSKHQHDSIELGERHECMFCNKGWKWDGQQWVEWDKL